MKNIGFLSFGHWTPSSQSQTRSAADALLQSIDLAVAAEELGADGAYFRVHHFARQLASPFPLLAAVGAKTSRIEIGTAVIDMRYENPLYMAEDAGAADLISGGRLQLGLSRGSPEQVIDGWRYFGYQPAEGETDADMGRRHTEVFLDVLRGKGFAQPNPRPMFPNPPGLLRLEPHALGLRDRIWWGAGSNATAIWAAKLGMNLQSSTLKNNETGEPFHIQQAAQIRAYRSAWKEAGHEREPRVSVSRSIVAIMDDRDRSYFGRGGEDDDQIGFIDPRTEAIFGRSYAAEPGVLIEQLKKDEAIAEADTLLLTVPNQLGVGYNTHVIEAILTHVAPALGWR
ncbi:MAG: LLM class flavin-dependent oxidoreductase [Xanthobacteraceae bacterium]